MHRTNFTLAFVCLFSIAGLTAHAQEFQVFDRKVQIHGFFTQGYVKTDTNNWLTMDTTDGSFAMTDMGLNLTSQMTDRLRVGAQAYDYDVGQLGQWHPSLDWAVADYRFTNWLGVRAGKVKTTLGLYNDTQDLDFLRPFALLPQGVYPIDLRETTIAHTGGDIYGTVPLRRRFGDISYTGFIGHRSDSIYSGYPYLLTEYGIFFHSLGGLEYGADLRWNTPLKGLTVGASRMNEDITGKGQFVDPLNPYAGLIPFQTSTRAYWTNQFYGEYLLRKLRIDTEYRRYFNKEPYIPESLVIFDSRSWYVSGAYRLSKHLELGSYYSHYTGTAVFLGAAAAFAATETNADLPQNHVYDKVVAGRVNINRFCYLKIEGHFMNGYGLSAYPDGFYLQQNPSGFKPDTNALVVKTGFHF